MPVACVRGGRAHAGCACRLRPPIGGVLATENAVIPYAVGVDIACRMKMTVLDIPVRDLEQKQDRLTRAIEAETRFGVGATFKQRRHHEVMDADWAASGVTKQNKDRAWSQLGTSGSGNHFVEFGVFTAHGPISTAGKQNFLPEATLPCCPTAAAAVPAPPCAIITAKSHSPNVAIRCRANRPRLAWLSLDSQEGQEYWNAMELMGRYAAANHSLIHKHVASNLGAAVLLIWRIITTLRGRKNILSTESNVNCRASERRDASGGAVWELFPGQWRRPGTSSVEKAIPSHCIRLSWRLSGHEPQSRQ